MWILIWVVLSSILIGASLWSLKILLRQKSAWEKYAKEKGFTFKRGTLMGPAEMEGVIGEYRVSFFTAERDGIDVRTRRLVTVMEVSVSDGLIDGGIMGTKETLPFMQSLVKLHPYKIHHPSWDESNMFAFVHNDGAVHAYLEPERIETITQILKTRNADSVIIFNHQEVLIRLETIDPIQETEKIDKVVKRTIALCDRLRITPEQRAAYMAQGEIPPTPLSPPPVQDAP